MDTNQSLNSSIMAAEELLDQAKDKVAALVAANDALVTEISEAKSQLRHSHLLNLENWASAGRHPLKIQVRASGDTVFQGTVAPALAAQFAAVLRDYLCASLMQRRRDLIACLGEANDQ